MDRRSLYTEWLREEWKGVSVFEAHVLWQQLLVRLDAEQQGRFLCFLEEEVGDTLDERGTFEVWKAWASDVLKRGFSTTVLQDVGIRSGMPTKEIFYRLGRVCWNLLFGERGAPRDFAEALARLEERTWEDTYLRGSLLCSDTAVFNLIAVAYWAESGFPVVQLGGHKYAAALMATAPRFEGVKAPWPAFMIELPVGLLTVIGREGKAVGLSHVIVLVADEGGEERWSFMAVTGSAGLRIGGTELWRLRLTVAQMERPVTQALGSDPFTLTLEDHDAKVLVLLTRLVFNVCIAMTNAEDVKKVGKSHYRPGLGRGPRFEREPTFRTYRVGKPVVIDVRPRLREYLEPTVARNGTPPTVQVLVCGHWTNQPYGPRHSLRRKQWIQPYWRGPLDAPILVRSHVLHGEGT